MDVYILQLNYWRGPIEAWTLYQNIGPPGSTPPERRFGVVMRLVLVTGQCVGSQRVSS